MISVRIKHRGVVPMSEEGIRLAVVGERLTVQYIDDRLALVDSEGKEVSIVSGMEFTLYGEFSRNDLVGMAHGLLVDGDGNLASAKNGSKVPLVDIPSDGSIRVDSVPGTFKARAAREAA